MVNGKNIKIFFIVIACVILRKTKHVFMYEGRELDKLIRIPWFTLQSSLSTGISYFTWVKNVARLQLSWYGRVSVVCGVACYKRLHVYWVVSPSKLHDVTDPPSFFVLQFRHIGLHGHANSIRHEISWGNGLCTSGSRHKVSAHCCL